MQVLILGYVVCSWRCVFLWTRWHPGLHSCHGRGRLRVHHRLDRLGGPNADTLNPLAGFGDARPCTEMHDQACPCMELASMRSAAVVCFSAGGRLQEDFCMCRPPDWCDRDGLCNVLTSEAATVMTSGNQLIRSHASTLHTQCDQHAQEIG